jgi:hypothetical protein
MCVLNITSWCIINLFIYLLFFAVVSRIGRKSTTKCIIEIKTNRPCIITEAIEIAKYPVHCNREDWVKRSFTLSPTPSKLHPSITFIQEPLISFSCPRGEKNKNKKEDRLEKEKERGEHIPAHLMTSLKHFSSVSQETLVTRTFFIASFINHVVLRQFSSSFLANHMDAHYWLVFRSSVHPITTPTRCLMRGLRRCCHGSRGTRNQEWTCWRRPAAIYPKPNTKNRHY